uniref:Peroxiredoxin-like 2A n=1 Tax=Anolis carolinensis TaxID=28377 RepID=A0A803T3X7_ANOCA
MIALFLLHKVLVDTCHFSSLRKQPSYLWLSVSHPILQKQFYGPQKRKMLFMGFIRCSVWRNFFRAWKSGYTGNIDGEGFVLGGVFVVGPGKQGVLLEHREKEFGDKVSLDAVLEAVKNIQPQPSEKDK